MMKTSEALEIIGGLSSPSKIPCYGYSIPANRCVTGQKLRNVENSICSKCYALKGHYTFSRVQNALERRFVSLSSPLWVEAMTVAINSKEKSGFFRWHDSGDLQSVEHLENIVKVCNGTPNIQHWLPTREYGIVGAFVRAGGVIPKNLTVRFSALTFDGNPPLSAARNLGVQVSSASKENFTCPASKQSNTCGNCRVCWNKEVENVIYKKH
jgi:hypothetical protein